MQLETNNRGNLILPASKLQPMIIGVIVAAIYIYFREWLEDGELLDELPSLPIVALFLIIATVATHLILLIQGDIEFDDRRRIIRRGKRPLLRYDQVKAVELRRVPDEVGIFEIALRRRTSPRPLVLTTEDETIASLDAASIARAIGTTVVVVG